MMRLSAALTLLVLLLPLAVHGDSSSVTVSVFTPQCTDGADNDSDLLTDYPSDPGCSSASDNDETDPVYHCSDSLDNDSDGLTDYPSDPGCDSLTDTSEFNLPSGGGGGGGGGGTSNEGDVTITLSGHAYPGSPVFLYRNNKSLLRSVAGPDARFTLKVKGLEAGSHVLSVVTEDKQKRRSALFTIPITLSAGASTEIGGIFLSPTLGVGAKEIRRGETVTLFGQTVPGSPVTLEVNSEEPQFFNTTSDQTGSYLVQFNSSVLELGGHSARSQSRLGSLLSPFAQQVSFKISNTSVSSGSVMRGDMNKDERVSILDFSIAAYWYKRQVTGDVVVDEHERLSGDGKIDLVDFSIMAYYWTN